MAELQKKATRESYGETLRDLAEKYRNWLFWMLTWLPQPKPASSRKHIRSVSSTAALPRQI